METQNEAQSYTIKTEVFEGPFGLLLDLIEKRKLFINDLSLAQVTEDYLAHMNRLGGLHHGEISSFVLVASTLLLIKSKSLLPGFNLTEEEEGDIKNLEERLRLYKMFSHLSNEIKDKFGKKIIFPSLPRKNEVLVFLPDEQITRESMMAFAKDVLGAIPEKTLLPEVEVRKVITLEEMLDKLTDRIQNTIKMNFREFAGNAGTREEKVTVIVGFLAMLELVRQGIMEATQDETFQDIMLEKMIND